METSQKLEKCGTDTPQASGCSTSVTPVNEVYTQVDHSIRDLARTISNESTTASAPLFNSHEISELDPWSLDFVAHRWIKAFQSIKTDADPSGHPRVSGVAFKNLQICGYNSSTMTQGTVGNLPLKLLDSAKELFGIRQEKIDIIHHAEALILPGECVAVLGPPGSGCSTLLKTIAGDTYGFEVSNESTINYHGIRPEQMARQFRGDAVYTAEVDEHFSKLTVGDTLYFAALARTPRVIPGGLTRGRYATHLRDVVMKIFGISHTVNTVVGDNFVRGVSGGERKRVTIAEAALSFAPLQCWDNSTRGLDSANAFEFCRSLKNQAKYMGLSSFVAIYQASQDAYDVFDKVMVLYEGRQIFFGKTEHAKAFFESLGFECPTRQTTADFLTSMSSPTERVVAPGSKLKAPRTPDDFARAWQDSEERRSLLVEIDEYLIAHPFDGQDHAKYSSSRKVEQAKMQRPGSAYTLSYFQQIKLNLWRSFQAFKGDPEVTAIQLASNLFEALVVGSIFYNLPPDTSSLNQRAIAHFFIIMMNALASVLEILTLYTKRKIVEKHSRYALYHPSAEAVASAVFDLPYKVVNSLLMNTLLYFMCNLRREPGAFFFFLLINFSTALSMSMLFRLIGSLTQTLAEALAPASIILLAVTLFSGFPIPQAYMLGWSKWIRYLNPVYYGFEALMLNEYHGKSFRCVDFVPSGLEYQNILPSQQTCSTVGSMQGSSTVSGTEYVRSLYGFVIDHKWRNFGLIVVFVIGLLTLHLIASELITSERSKGEILVFLSNKKSRTAREARVVDEESVSPGTAYQDRPHEESNCVASEKTQQNSIFHWESVCYDVKIKSETRRILDNVNGWVKPGTLTALMGSAGAGKTTLLDCLASRVSTGVLTGDMFVDGKLRDASFQRQTGYVQQQDLHLETSTVREALTFSALLRQSPIYSKREKLDYVDTVIDLLNMQEFEGAIVGVPGQGLNVEQRKRFTIGVELAARPQLLLFLDEPTSGLDSQTSWSICGLMRRLADNGQAILCTIHQPSAMLFQRFDRLLLLARGGRTVYFGDIGHNSEILVDYFVRNGAYPCDSGANPAEYILQEIGAAAGSKTEVDWPETWKNSEELTVVREELRSLKATRSETEPVGDFKTSGIHTEYAATSWMQLAEASKRLFQQYWRSPGYIYSKGLLSVGSAFFIGFCYFQAERTQKGIQNQQFGVFLLLLIFGTVIEQLMPVFVTQRTLYEARERPSKTYSWQVFLCSSILVEIVWNSLMGVLCFLCWYYPIGLHQNAVIAGQTHSRGVCAFLIVWIFMVFTSSFGHLMIVAIESPDAAASINNAFFILMFAFAGVIATKDEFPGFWIFMYRVNPLQYITKGLLSVTLAGAPVYCADNEYLVFDAPPNATCEEYMAPYLASNPGFLSYDSLGEKCRYCPTDTTDDFLASIDAPFNERWMNFGLILVFVAFNIVASFLLYYIFRLPRTKKNGKKEPNTKVVNN